MSKEDNRSSPIGIGPATRPPSLNGRTAGEASESVARICLSDTQHNALPSDEELPITAGRIHFIRLVDERGEIALLNETRHIHKRLAGEYVWATIVTHEHGLYIYHRRCADEPVCLVKSHRYLILEKVMPLLPLL